MSSDRSTFTGRFTDITDAEFREYTGGGYLCEIHLTHDLQNGFTAMAARLPSVSAKGSTEKEALEAITSALVVVAKLHRQQSGRVPWTEPLLAPSGVLVRWVTVDTN